MARFKIKIERIDTTDWQTMEWVQLRQPYPDEKAKNDRWGSPQERDETDPQFGHRKVTKRTDTMITVLEQVVDEIDLAKVIAAVNRLELK